MIHIPLFFLACAPAATESADSGAAVDTPVAAATNPYESAETCAQCHPRQFDEWRQSMHAYAARSPVFDAMNQKALRDSANGASDFCAGCHSQVGRAQHEPGTYTAKERSEASLEGITCDFCHTAVGHEIPLANSRMLNEPGLTKRGPYENAHPPTHIGQYSDFVTSPELCGTCHDVIAFPDLAIEEAYTEYVVGPSREEGIRCQDCHMSPVPGVAGGRTTGPSAVIDGSTFPDREQVTHLWVGPDYSLLDDFPYPDDLEASAAAVQTYLARREVLLQNAAKIADIYGEVVDRTMTVHADVQSLIGGHRIPTGFTSERQVWVAVTVIDAAGRIVFQSGDLDQYGDLRNSLSWDVIAGAVREDDQLVNFQTKNIVLRRAYAPDGTFTGTDEDIYGTEVAFPFEADYLEKNSLAPKEVRPLQWVVDVENTTPPYDVEVALRYRHMPPYVLRSLQLDEYLPKLVVTTIDTESMRVEAP